MFFAELTIGEECYQCLDNGDSNSLEAVEEYVGEQTMKKGAGYARSLTGIIVRIAYTVCGDAQSRRRRTPCASPTPTTATPDRRQHQTQTGQHRHEHTRARHGRASRRSHATGSTGTSTGTSIIARA